MVYDILAYARTKYPEEVIQRHWPEVKQYVHDALADDLEAQRLAAANFELLVYTDEDVAAVLGISIREFTRINERLQRRYRDLLAQLGVVGFSTGFSRFQQRIRHVVRSASQIASGLFA